VRPLPDLDEQFEQGDFSAFDRVSAFWAEICCAEKHRMG